MKARFTAEDYNKMMAQPMPFAQEDVRLINLGMELRELHLTRD